MSSRPKLLAVASSTYCVAKRLLANFYITGVRGLKANLRSFQAGIRNPELVCQKADLVLLKDTCRSWRFFSPPPAAIKVCVQQAACRSPAQSTHPPRSERRRTSRRPNFRCGDLNAVRLAGKLVVRARKHLQRSRNVQELGIRKGKHKDVARSSDSEMLHQIVHGLKATLFTVNSINSVWISKDTFRRGAKRGRMDINDGKILRVPEHSR